MLIGRAKELEALRAALESARAGASAVVCVHGEAGTGKTALLHGMVSGVAHTTCPTSAVPRSVSATRLWWRYSPTAACARARRLHCGGATCASKVRERTLLAQRATDADGSIKSTKGRKSRPVRLLGPLAADLREWRMAAERPFERALVFPRTDDGAWTKDDWNNWRSRTWRTACQRAGLEEVPRPYDLRHSFASLLLAEGRTVHYVASQLGHSPTLTLDTYGHVVAEFADAEHVDAEAEIRAARRVHCRAASLGNDGQLEATA